MKNQGSYICLMVMIFTIGINTEVKAQNEVIPLWSKTIPGEINSNDYQEKKIYKENKLQSVSMVKTPTLSVYLPHKVDVNGTAVVIFPGGGYSHLAMEKEGEKVANWLNSFGITAFVLKYRLPNDQIMKDKSLGPLQDAQESIRLIRRNLQKWKLDSKKIGLIGFSAGGHLAASLSTHYKEKIYFVSDTISARPDFTLLIYPVISMENEITHKGSLNNLLGSSPSIALIETFSNELNVNSETPKTFLVHATDDTIVPVENSIKYYLALKKYKVPAELHLYEKGGHGFGLGRNETSLFWTTACQNWMKSNNYITQ
jgi:acetyl esterase/lipase